MPKQDGRESSRKSRAGHPLPAEEARPSQPPAALRSLPQKQCCGPRAALPWGRKHRQEASRQVAARLGQSLWNSQGHLPLRVLGPEVERPKAFGAEQPAVPKCFSARHHFGRALFLGSSAHVGLGFSRQLRSSSPEKPHVPKSATAEWISTT